MKRTRSTVSLLLILSMLLSVLPGTAAAEINEITTEPITEALPVSEETAVTETAPDAELSIIHEDVSLRGAYEKHFLMSDGSYQVTLYNEPVHQQENGEWVEIDNTLSLQTAADGTARYATANGLADVSFSQSVSDQLVTMQQGDYSVSWGVQAVSNGLSTMSTMSVEPVQAELVTSDLSTFSAEEQKTLVEKSSSAIQYRNALRQDVDLEYIVLPSRVKENIILQSPQDISYYVVTVYTENLSARLLENRRIEFYNDSDEVIFTMASPYMYDSGAELSEDIAVEMIEKGDGCYFIKMTPDPQWLNDESRVYPVVIDPQVSTSTVQQNIIDNYVLEGSGVQNNNLDRLYIGNKSGSRARAYIQFAAMPTIPSGNIILSAEMTVQILAGTSTANTANAYMVTGADWASGTITWDNKPAAATTLATNISHNNLTKYTFSCLTAVKHWYTGMPNGQYQNYGIMLRYSNESIADYNSVYSADCTDETLRPVMTINYQSSIEEIWIREGSIYTLTVNTSSTVTWTSSNTSVATVSSSGKITGVGSGEATITGTVNGSTVHTCTVHVMLRDGVYRIKNSSSDVYIGTTGGIADGTITSLKIKSTSGSAQLWQLWKITYLDNGYYSIRPLYKLDMALGLNGANVSIYTVGTTDSLSGVPSTNRWTITADALGYAIKRLGSNGLAMAPSNDTPASGTAIVVTPYSSTNTARHWSLERVSSPPSGVLLYDTSTGKSIGLSSRYIAAGTTKTLAELDFAAYAYSGNAASTEKIIWSCTSGSSYLTINQNTGTITAISPGTALITGSSQYGSFNLYITVTGSSSANFTLINQYDLSFKGDVDFEIPNLVDHIDDAVAFVSQAYQKQFSISFSSSTDPYYREEAITDQCPAEYYYQSCHTSDECGDSCNATHHKNLYRISDHLYSPTIPQNHIVVFWTNRDAGTYCRNGNCTDDLAFVYQYRPVIHIMTILDNDNDDWDHYQICMSLLLAHEIAHTLGLEEQYNDSSHAQNEYCVMNKYSFTDTDMLNQLTEGDTNLFCASCEAKINQLLSERE